MNLRHHTLVDLLYTFRRPCIDRHHTPPLIDESINVLAFGLPATVPSTQAGKQQASKQAIKREKLPRLPFGNFSPRKSILRDLGGLEGRGRFAVGSRGASPNLIEKCWFVGPSLTLVVAFFSITHRSESNRKRCQNACKCCISS